MKTTDFYQPLTSSKLNENLEKQFGTRVNLKKYTREQLEDMRNKIRTITFQQEAESGINDLLTNETYQKNQAMLQLLNTRIKEMLGENIKALKDKMIELSEGKKGVKNAKHPQGTKKATKDYDGNGKVETPKDEVWGSRAKAAAKAGKPFQEAMKKKCCCATKGEDNCPVHGMKEGWEDMIKHSKELSDKVDAEKKAKGKSTSKTGHNVDRSKPGVVTATKKAEKTDEGKTACSNGHTKMTKGCDECAGMWESTGDYSAKKAAAGKDIGKPGKNFAKIEKSAGGGEKGKRIAGAVLKKLRAKESVENFRHNVRFVNESLGYLLAEDEEGKAKAITAASDIVNDFTSWMQRVGQYQTKAIIELADAIKADFGAAEAETFKQSVAPALSATLETLTQQRETISSAVAVLAGEAAPEEPMGMEPEMPAEEPGMDAAAPDEMNPDAGDEFGAADAAAGAGTTGREIRESREQRRARKLSESHSIMAKLAK